MHSPMNNDLARRRQERFELGQTMSDIRFDAKVTRTALARHLHITPMYLKDMEDGNRNFQPKYIDPIIDYCADAARRRRNLIKNQ